RAEHLARLHAVGVNAAVGAVGLAVAILVLVALGLESLWDASFVDSDLARAAGLLAAALFGAACVLVPLGLHQERRDRAAAIACLDRAIPELLAGGDPRAVLTTLSEHMRRLAPPRFVESGTFYLPARLDARWLGSRAFTKLCLGCCALLLAALLL